MRKLDVKEFDQISGGVVGGPIIVYQINGPNQIEAQIAADFKNTVFCSATTTTNWQQFFDGTIQRGEGALAAIGGAAAALRNGNTAGASAAIALGAARFANGVYLQQTASGKACVK